MMTMATKQAEQPYMGEGKGKDDDEKEEVEGYVATKMFKK
jgi:hypothetical protein